MSVRPCTERFEQAAKEEVMTTVARSPLRLLEALATPHGVDRYLELVNPMLTVRELRARITEVDRTTPDSTVLTLRPTRQWGGFRAGQFVQLSVDVDGVRRTRCYSPSDSQHRADGCLELTVKAHADGLVSRWLHANARPGLVIGLAPAAGTFCLPEQRPRRLLLISGGSGITPVLSMLRTVCDERHRGEIGFLHYARSRAQVPHRDDIERIAADHRDVRIRFGYSRSGDGDVVGRFHPDHLEATAPWYADAETYVCGPPQLMQAVREHYERVGLAERLHTEQFVPPSPVPATEQATGTVTFARTGASAANSGATLLEQAEAAGLTPEHGCRMGICFSCTQRKTSGCTRNIRTGETSTDPDSEIQLCINVPVGDVAIDI
jgi:stearoyl-CoA 9-desaturase NADPH oxidoreductase